MGTADSPLLQWTEQLELQEAERTRIIKELDDNKKVLRLLLERFRAFQAEAAELARQPEQPQEPDLNKYFSNVEDVRQLDWYNDGRGAPWWLDRAIETLDRHRRDLVLANIRSENFLVDTQRSRDATTARIQQRVDDDEQAELNSEAEMRAIFAPLTPQGEQVPEEEMDLQLTVVQERRDREREAMEQLQREDYDLVTSYDWLKQFRSGQLALRVDSLARYSILMQICQYFRIDLAGNIPLQYLNALYRLMWLFLERGTVVQQISDLLDIIPDRSFFIGILNAYLAQHGWNLANHDNHTATQILEDSQEELRELKSLLNQYRIMANAYNAGPLRVPPPDAALVRELAGMPQVPPPPNAILVRELEGTPQVPPPPDSDLMRELAGMPEPPPPDYAEREPPPDLLPAYAEAPPGPESRFRQSSREKVAKDLLEGAYSALGPRGDLRPTRYTWGFVLKRLFNSPDIAPHFRSRQTTTFSHEEFLTFVNSLVAVQIPPSIMNAWLVYCTKEQEFFSQSYLTQRVTISQTGWELCYESPVSNLQRKIDPDKLAKPENSKQL